MTTKKQIQANRRNAQKSTGPKSQMGKLIASHNSMRHGFYASTVVLPDEDREEFLRLARRVVHAYAPRDVLEEIQVRTIIETQWQLRRANVVDAQLFRMYAFYENEVRDVGTAFANDAAQGNSFSKLVRYQGFLVRKLQLAQKELRELQKRGIQSLSDPVEDRREKLPVKEPASNSISSESAPESNA